VAADFASLAPKLCAALFSGGEIEHARAHAIASPFVVAEHTHTDLLQFDWIVNCRGSVMIAGVETALVGACAFVLVAPKRSHAMSLEAAADGARVYHTRLALPAATRRTLRIASAVTTNLPINASLEAALNDVWRLTVGGIRRPLLRAARMAEAIVLWPGANDGADEATVRVSPGLDRDLDAALKLMERSLVGLPPTLDSLADAAGLSVRHFTRRFRDAFGIPPIEFLDRKRLSLAQQMLAYESAAVGEVAERMGFSSPAVFSRWFANLANETPTAYRSRPHAL
jgi:AraC-like DNA-binding protein